MGEYSARMIPMSEMREPTNLELAQLVMVQSQAVMAMMQYLLVMQNILADEEEQKEAIVDLSNASDVMSTWWLNMKKDAVLDTDSE